MDPVTTEQVNQAASQLTIENVLIALASVGALGNGLSRIPWLPAQALGRVLSALSIDLVKLFQAMRGKSSSGASLSVRPAAGNGS